MVMRMSAGWRRKRARSVCGRVAGADGDLRWAERDAGGASEGGDGFERGAEVAFHVDGERFEGADVEDAALRFSSRRLARGSRNMRRSRHQRKAVRVLPVPVGARMRVVSPRAMAGQPRRCGVVGVPSAERNHARVTGWKSASGSEVWGSEVGFFVTIAVERIRRGRGERKDERFARTARFARIPHPQLQGCGATGFLLGPGSSPAGFLLDGDGFVPDGFGGEHGLPVGVHAGLLAEAEEENAVGGEGAMHAEKNMAAGVLGEVDHDVAEEDDVEGLAGRAKGWQRLRC